MEVVVGERLASAHRSRNVSRLSRTHRVSRLHVASWQTPKGCPGVLGCLLSTRNGIQTAERAALSTSLSALTHGAVDRRPHH